MLRSLFATTFSTLSLNRLYAAVTLIGLALALAAAIIIGLFVRQQFAYERFIPGHERVFRMTATIAQPGQPERSSAITPSVLAAAVRARTDQVEAVARIYQDTPLIREAGDRAPVRARGFVWADPDIFRVLPLQAVAGDPATALAEPDSIVITRSTARRLFGRDAPIGAPVNWIAQKGVTRRLKVTAVLRDLPPETHLDLNFIASGRGAETPLGQADANPMPTLGAPIVTYVRTRPGVTAATLQPAIDEILLPFQAMAAASGTKVGGYALPIAGIHFGPADDSPHGKPSVDRSIVIAIGGVGMLILVMASTSYVALMTARSARRGVEVAVRKACGASRRQLLIHYLGESLVLTLIAMILAMGLVELALPAVNAVLGLNLTFDVTRDPMLLLPLLGGWLITGLVSGLYPALILSSVLPSTALAGGPAGPGSAERIGRAMVVVQFAILVGLTLATITLYRQTQLAIASALGADRGPILTLQADCRQGFPQAVRELPGVRHASCVAVGALNMGPQGAVTAVNREGQRFTPGFVDVDAHFFPALGLKPIAGRGFTIDGRGDAARQEVVLNQTAARNFGFATPQSAIGQPIGISLEVGATPRLVPHRIVGVVPDAPASVLSPAGELIYNPGTPEGGILAVEVAPGALAEVREGLDHLWQRLGDGGPLDARLLSQIEHDRYRATIVQGWVIAACALVALVIAAMGLFALSAFSADRRTKEIGIRRAMGASRGEIVRLLLWQFAKPFLLACAIGLPLGYVVMRRWLEQFVTRVDLSPWLLGTVVAVTAGFALAAALAHVVAAARASPVTALRHE